MNIIEDVPVLSFPQFTALHMAVSMSGNEHLISPISGLNQSWADGWRPIAVSSSNEVLYLAKPREEEEEEEEE